ncbi:hypothetical protein TNCV_1676161 [Trichonephila clavipes]|nr:hypothetical protein TNCV_1676161 [Trichonephila clavipes]
MDAVKFLHRENTPTRSRIETVTADIQGVGDARGANKGNKRKEEIKLSVGFRAGRGQPSFNMMHLSRGKAPFIAMGLKSLMGELTYTEKDDMYYMYDRRNSHGRDALRMYLAQFPDLHALL